jgi:predicted ABC-type ATPase
MTKQLYIIGGSNGSGKTTGAFALAPEFLAVNEFVNADEIARGLSPLNPEGVAVIAGRMMLERIESLVTHQRSFALETTCAGRGHATLIERCQALGYEVTLLFLWLPSIEMAIERVALRVAQEEGTPLQKR